MKKIDIGNIIFIVLLFLQNFALITTDDFGINGMVCWLFLISILNFKIYYAKIQRKRFILLLLVVLFVFLSSIVNKTYYITQILRYIMIFWLMYASNLYIERIYIKKEQKHFFNLYTNILLIFLLYGIYELIANIFQLPLFINIFANNPSYAQRGLYRYYGGWNDSTRLYNAFFEPSAFSVFLVYNFFFIKEMKDISKNKKIALYILIIFNLIFTYARTGYVMFLYMCGIYFIYNVILAKKEKTPIIDILVLSLPFVNVLIMYFIGLNLFDDLSSLGRTYSAIYYLFNSFSNFKHILFGHSIGSIVNGEVSVKYVEQQAHNGYVDIIYQLGLIMFIGFFIFLYKKVKQIKHKKYLIIGVLSTFCCFASYFCVETLVVQLVLIYNFCKNEDKTIGE